MEQYLQPVDDGLPMRESGPWTAEKLDYLARYINVFETAMRNKFPIRRYVDLFAGPGKNRVKKSGNVLLGSPLLALTTRFPFTSYFFSDLSADNAAALGQRCNASSSCPNVEIQIGDCNRLVEGVVNRIKGESRPSLNLAFLDPEGMELKWETVAKLASVGKMDLIIYYPRAGLTRNVQQEFERPGGTAIDEFFGDQRWREIYETSQMTGGADQHRRFIDYYKSKLRALGYAENEIVCEPLIRNERNAPLYHLLFASKHPLGYKFWREVTNRDMYGQKRLFEEPNLYN
jgi:three-Cys-motif partner protein